MTGTRPTPVQINTLGNEVFWRTKCPNGHVIITSLPMSAFLIIALPLDGSESLIAKTSMVFSLSVS
jgi:hypothetical protein